MREEEVNEKNLKNRTCARTHLWNRAGNLEGKQSVRLDALWTAIKPRKTQSIL